MVHKKRRYIVSIEISKGLEKSEKDGKTGKWIIGTANFWYAFGASCISLGGAFISFGPTISTPERKILNLSFGGIMFIAGLSMIKAASNIERELGKPPVYSSFTELWRTNKSLIFGLSLLIVWVFLIIIAYLGFIFH